MWGSTWLAGSAPKSYASFSLSAFLDQPLWRQQDSAPHHHVSMCFCVRKKNKKNNWSPFFLILKVRHAQCRKIGNTECKESENVIYNLTGKLHFCSKNKSIVVRKLRCCKRMVCHNYVKRKEINRLWFLLVMVVVFVGFFLFFLNALKFSALGMK